MTTTLVIIGGIAAVILLFLLFTRRTAADRRRAANWDDLHERGKLFAVQLSHLRDVAAKNGGAETLARSPAAKTGWFGTRRPHLKKEAAAGSPIEPATRD